MAHVPIFSYGDGILWLGSTLEPWKILGINIAGVTAIIAWAAFWSLVMFGTLQHFKILRVDRETEFKGNDIIKHGESAYPMSAWIEHQYNNNPKGNQGGQPNAAYLENEQPNSPSPIPYIATEGGVGHKQNICL